ncbi:MAG: hypothetical protein WDZ59_06535 [Pirellulales bacterium]
MTGTFNPSPGTTAEGPSVQSAEGHSDREVSREETDALLEAVDRLIGDANRTVGSGPLLPAADPTSGDDDQEDSIEQYMAKLMQRVGSRSGSERPAPQFPKPVHRQSLPTAPSTKTPVQPEQPAPARREPIRRAPAPEKTRDLSRLREVANQSATTAVRTHYRNSMRRTVGLLAMTCGCLLAAYALLTWTVVAQPWSSAAAVLILGAAATALWRYHKAVRLLTAASPQDSYLASPRDVPAARPLRPSDVTPVAETSADQPAAKAN